MSWLHGSEPFAVLPLLLPVLLSLPVLPVLIANGANGAGGAAADVNKWCRCQ
jgi:hypothetical protein